MAWRYNSYLDLLPDIEAVCLSFYHWHHHNTWQFSQSFQAMSNPLQSLPADYLFPFSLLESHIYSHIWKQANEFKLTSHGVTKDKNSCSQMTWNLKKNAFPNDSKKQQKICLSLKVTWYGFKQRRQKERSKPHLQFKCRCCSMISFLSLCLIIDVPHSRSWSITLYTYTIQAVHTSISEIRCTLGRHRYWPFLTSNTRHVPGITGEIQQMICILQYNQPFWI